MVLLSGFMWWGHGAVAPHLWLQNHQDNSSQLGVCIVRYSLPGFTAVI
jgi:hypothetical protein